MGQRSSEIQKEILKGPFGRREEARTLIETWTAKAKPRKTSGSE